MPPLQVERFYGPQDDYITIEDNRIFRGKTNNDIFSQAPVPGETQAFVVLAQREILVKPSPLFEEQDDESVGKATNVSDTSSVVSVLDVFTNLCVCAEANKEEEDQVVAKRQNVNKERKKRKLEVACYPVAVYPERLNSPAMVQQRRKSLEKYLTFLPIKAE